MIQKFFTLEEAERLIPKIEPIVGSLMENKRSAVELGQELAQMQEQVKLGKEAKVEATDLFNKRTELEFLVRIINEGLDAVEETGAQPKDLDEGLVDFPTVLDGEEMLLCWKYGEKSIRFYHGLEEGYAGRKPLQRG